MILILSKNNTKGTVKKSVSQTNTGPRKEAPNFIAKKQTAQQNLRAAVFSDIIKLPKMITTENYYKPIQLKLPVDYERIIDINDSVYSFVEVLDQIDLKKYLVEKDCRTGRPQFDLETLLRKAAQ
ncbi:hypothetical protein [Ruminococcus sp.]|uniref:hypothetical protein n=1 Tax=Ruminococcus sp. TaxID=41978 RepID=UPI00260027AD|nr:hypothetical protein [Ruminococcus sp.]